MVYFSSGHKCPYDLDKVRFITADQMGCSGSGLLALEAGKDVIVLDNVCFIRKMEDRVEDTEELE